MIKETKKFLLMIIFKIKGIFIVEKIKPVIINTLSNKMLEGKIALITGGSGGIGFSIASKFVESGAKVVIVGRSEEKLKSICDKLGRDKAKYFAMDICNIDNIHYKFNNLIGLLDSNEKIDILVNSAGVHGNQKYGTITEEDWDSVINTNLKGLYFMSQEVSNYMKDNKINGNILNISSASALKPAWSPYEISKWGVKGITLGLARELIPYGIVVNALAPGPTATDMIHYKEGNSLNWSTNPSGRIATTEEIADLAVYMVSGLGRYVVGDTFYITGGSGTICIDK